MASERSEEELRVAVRYLPHPGDGPDVSLALQCARVYALVPLHDDAFVATFEQPAVNPRCSTTVFVPRSFFLLSRTQPAHSQMISKLLFFPCAISGRIQSSWLQSVFN